MLPAACLLLLFGMNLRADIQEVFSLEWVADHSAAIGVYKVVFLGQSAEAGGAKDAANRYGIKLELQETLKGDPPKSAETPANRPYSSCARVYEGLGDSKVLAGDPFLVCFSPKKGALQPTDFINIAKMNRETVMDARIEALTDGGAILRVVRERIAHAPAAAKNNAGMADDKMYEHFSPIPCELPVGAIDGAEMEVPEDLRDAAITRCELLILASGLQVYLERKHTLPAGGNARIAAALRKEKLIDFKPRLNAAGEMCDIWGTPYRMGAPNPESPWAYSCGPDKKDDGGAPGSDDVTSW